MAIGAKIKIYGLYVFGILGVAIFWGGLWGTSKILVPKAYLTFIIGLFLLALANIIKDKMDPAAKPNREINDVLHKLHKHPQKHQFHIKYHDKIKRKHVYVKAEKLHHLENEHIVFIENNDQETFIPVHRILEILQNKETHWKK